MTEYSENDFPQLNITAKAGDMLTQGKQLLLPLDLSQNSPAGVLDVLTASQTPIPNTDPVKYMNPAAKFDYYYQEFTEAFTKAVRKWDDVDTDQRTYLVENMDGPFYVLLDKSYDSAKEMLAILKERKYCNQFNTVNYRNKLIKFIAILAEVLGKEAEPSTKRSF